MIFFIFKLTWHVFYFFYFEAWLFVVNRTGILDFWDGDMRLMTEIPSHRRFLSRNLSEGQLASPLSCTFSVLAISSNSTISLSPSRTKRTKASTRQIWHRREASSGWQLWDYPLVYFLLTENLHCSSFLSGARISSYELLIMLSKATHSHSKVTWFTAHRVTNRNGWKEITPMGRMSERVVHVLGLCLLGVG